MTACVVNCGRDAEHGYMCEQHYTHLTAMLRDIEDEAATLTVVPSMQIQSGPGGGSLASHRAPANLDALVAQDPRRGDPHSSWAEVDPWGLDDTLSVLHVLHSWARLVRDELAITY